MEAPKCLFCETRHWPWQPCPKAKEFAAASAVAKTELVRKAIGVPRNKGKFDRNAYQREYMRKWRKKKRHESTA
jgi:hypothetical protein